MLQNNKRYTILRDLFTSLTITFILILIPEIILPGIVSSKVSTNIFFAASLGAAFFLANFGRNIEKHDDPRFQAISRNILNCTLFGIASFLILSLYKMAIWEIAITILFSVMLVILAERMLIWKE